MPATKIWRPRSAAPDRDSVARLAAELRLLPLTAEILLTRGLSEPEEARAFLSLTSTYLHDPFGLPDMRAAAERLSLAIDRREQIAIYGDYDVDGVTSTATLVLWLRTMGLSPLYHIPDREGEGYGLSVSALDRLHAQGATLVVTVDTGVTALAEAAHCRALGMDLIITDHHECRDVLPEAIAVVDPKRPDSGYPFDGLAGVGVAFKLVSAVELYRHPGEDPDVVLRSVCRSYIDLAALGTVADVMPLTDENRFIVSRGLEMMEKRPRPALTALLRAVAMEKGSGKEKISTTLISFTLAPRINAAGRVASALLALELFLVDPVRADEAARALCDCNRLRQTEEVRITNLVERILDAHPAASANSIVLGGEDFCGGVLGIVAAKLCERYDKPTILLSFEGEEGKGSGRAPEGVNLVGALDACADLLTRYGGHAMAAGLALEKSNLEAFARRFDEAVASSTREIPVREYDLAIAPSHLSLRAAQELTLLEPCGAGNPLPLFCWMDAQVQAVQLLGEKHTKLVCTGEGISHPVLLFGTPRARVDLFPGDTVDLLFELSVNEFRGNTTLQLIARDWRPAHGQMWVDKCHRQKAERLMSGDYSLLTPADLPNREECGRIYRILRERLGISRTDLISPRQLIQAGEEYPRLMLSLQVLSDAGLITVKGDFPLTVTLAPVRQKVDLTATPLWSVLYSAVHDPERRTNALL